MLSQIFPQNWILPTLNFYFVSRSFSSFSFECGDDEKLFIFPPTLLINKLSCRLKYRKRFFFSPHKLFFAQQFYFFFVLWNFFYHNNFLMARKISAVEILFIRIIWWDNFECTPCPGKFVIHLSPEKFLLFLSSFLLKFMNFPQFLAGNFAILFTSNLVHDWEPKIWRNAVIFSTGSEVDFMNEWRLFSAKVSACAQRKLQGKFPMLECTFRFPDSACLCIRDFLYLCKKRACNVLVLTLTPLAPSRQCPVINT